MGHRTVKRVPLNFEWPHHQVWQGYQLPEHLREDPCLDCHMGATSARRWVAQIAALALLVDDDRQAQEHGRPLHPYLQDTGTRATGRPSADIAEFGQGLAGREPSPLGHDGIDNMRAERRLIEAAGLDPDAWGICTACHGEGSIERYEGQRADKEAWEPTEPPTGQGWQLWETTSEGSPVSPVCESAEELATWCAGNATAFGSMQWTRDQWLASFREGTTDVDSLGMLRI